MGGDRFAIVLDFEFLSRTRSAMQTMRKSALASCQTQFEWNVQAEAGGSALLDPTGDIALGSVARPAKAARSSTPRFPMPPRLAILALLLLAAAPAAAQDMDFSKIKCSEFIASPKDEVGSILMWLEGFYTKSNAPPIMYQDKTMKDLKGLAEYCTAHGEDNLIKAADAVMPVK
jgi:HdeA/HdeB family protein